MVYGVRYRVKIAMCRIKNNDHFTKWKMSSFTVL